MKYTYYILIALTIIGLVLGLGLGLGLNKKDKKDKKDRECVFGDNDKFVMNKTIPKNIFISLTNKEILNDDTNKVSNIIKKTIKDFPEYNVKIYDDDESYELVKSFGDSLLTICYNEIIPAAYKCDIFRLVFLYMYGGIYLDAGMSIFNVNKVNTLIESNEMILCKDREGVFGDNDIYNTFMVSVKENPFIMRAINKIKKNILNFKYGNNMLDITGPTCLGKIYKEYYGYYCYEGQQFSNIYILRANEHLIICDKNNKIASKTKDFLGKSKSNNIITGHYSELWGSNKVFYQLTINNWHSQAKNYFINKDGELCAYLKNNKGKYKFSSIKYEPNTIYKNKNGKFIKQII